MESCGTCAFLSLLATWSVSSARKAGVFSGGVPSFDSPWERLEKEWRGGKRKMSPEGRREWTFP